MAEIAPSERPAGTETEPARTDGEGDGHELDEALRQVNRIRVEHGVDPLYELPVALPAHVPGSTCVLQEAFADIGVASVDYYDLVGPDLRVPHGLSWFVRRFDAGAYPQLIRHDERKTPGRPTGEVG
jgi:hypothetical protein